MPTEYVGLAARTPEGHWRSWLVDLPDIIGVGDTWEASVQGMSSGLACDSVVWPEPTTYPARGHSVSAKGAVGSFSYCRSR